MTIYSFQLLDDLPLYDLLSPFPDDFVQKIRKFRYRKDALASLYGRLLLRYGYQQLTGQNLTFDAVQYGEIGKPFLPNSTIQFNISHSYQMVVCALTKNNPIGIDIEYKKLIDIADFKFQMTEGEWSAINAAVDRMHAFYNYWTKKEAVMKSTGKGFTLPLKSFEVLPEATDTSLNEKRWYFKEVNVHQGYLCHVTIDRPFLADCVVQRLKLSDLKPLFSV
ncbi:MAG: 4'-phosphopantetheinyl transferase superfamily protein [Bacteroidota bacterium]